MLGIRDGGRVHIRGVPLTKQVIFSAARLLCFPGPIRLLQRAHKQSFALSLVTSSSARRGGAVSCSVSVGDRRSQMLVGPQSATCIKQVAPHHILPSQLPHLITRTATHRVTNIHSSPPSSAAGEILRDHRELRRYHNQWRQLRAGGKECLSHSRDQQQQHDCSERRPCPSECQRRHVWERAWRNGARMSLHLHVRSMGVE